MKDRIHTMTTVTVSATMTLTEGELGALDALAGYGTDGFLKTFYKEMGEAYLRPYEKHLRSLFEKIREVAPPALQRANQMRRDIENADRQRAQPKPPPARKAIAADFGIVEQ